MRSGRVRVVALAVVVMIAGCGLGPRDAKPDPDAARLGAADSLGDGYEGVALADLLGPDERAAAARAGIPLTEPPPDPTADAAAAPPDAGPPGSAAAAVGIAFLQVGLSLAAMAAPFFAL